MDLFKNFGDPKIKNNNKFCWFFLPLVVFDYCFYGWMSLIYIITIILFMFFSVKKV